MSEWDDEIAEKRAASERRAMTKIKTKCAHYDIYSLRRRSQRFFVKHIPWVFRSFTYSTNNLRKESQIYNALRSITIRNVRCISFEISRCVVVAVGAAFFSVCADLFGQMILCVCIAHARAILLTRLALHIWAAVWHLDADGFSLSAFLFICFY